MKIRFMGQPIFKKIIRLNDILNAGIMIGIQRALKSKES